MAPQTTQSSSLMCVSAAEHHIAKQAEQNPESISQETVYHRILARTSSRYQAVEKLLWKQTCFSKIILESNVTQNITKSSDFFRTVLPLVNAFIGDALCVTWRLS